MLPYSSSVDSCTPDAQDVSAGVSCGRASSTNTSWDCWSTFSHSLNTDPKLQHTDDPILLLQIIAHHYHWGEQGCTVGDAVRAIGQMLANLGFNDLRLLPSGKLNFCLSHQLAAYKKSDPPPSQVKPIPIMVLQHTYSLLQCATHPRSTTIAKLILGFFI